ncbi:hypothetical protein BaRGS_00021445 [Batillaria attramentaria]|uniref:Uncharacterized protein n=1 Tax=Batillaria attramentaria TaxID=370345 RepID=A0ABD0KK30_9CAEN
MYALTLHKIHVGLPPFFQTREIPPRRPPQTRSAPSLPSVTDGDAPLFDDADVHDEVKEDEAKKKIDKQCARIVGMLEEHVSSRPSAKTGRKRKLED